MRSKLKSLKKLFQQPEETSLVPSRFEYYCEGDDMPVGMFQKQSHRFRYYFTKYPHLQHPSDFLQDLDKKNNNIHSKLSFRSLSISYNSIQERLFQQLCQSVFEFDNVWFQNNDTFIQQLSLALKFALVAMTNKSQQHIQAYLKGESLEMFQQRVRKWNTPIHGYLPIFFPLYEKYKTQLKKKSLSQSYQYLVTEICPTLTDQEIVDCLVVLVQQIRHIFSLCPKTTRKITLWRGLRSTPSLSYAGFTSMSLDPFHTLHYTTGNCCLQKITILPNTPLLFIGGLSSFKRELECVLPENLQLYEMKRSMETIPVVKTMKQKCPDSQETRRIMVQHVVVL
jgi:hypothetical protein